LVLTRHLGEALMRLNPCLSTSAYRDAMRQITDVNLSQPMLAIYQEKDRLHKNGVLISYRDNYGERQRKTLRISDVDNPGKKPFHGDA